MREPKIGDWIASTRSNKIAQIVAIKKGGECFHTKPPMVKYCDNRRESWRFATDAEILRHKLCSKR